MAFDRHGSVSSPRPWAGSAICIVLALFLLSQPFGGNLADAKRNKRPDFCRQNDTDDRNWSFLWQINSTPPSYFFGTIHVPYSRVWDYVADNVKKAFDAADAVFFELDLTDPSTISALTSCQLLPAGQSLSDVLPADLYRRLKRHLEYVKNVMPSWMSADQRGRGLYADYLFSAITGNWERKRPIWVMLMVNSLTEMDVKSRGIPVLDLYLAQEAERRNKRMGAVERVEEQCVPLNGLNLSQVVFALNQTLHQQESLRAGDQTTPYTTDDLIRHYNCGDLDAVIFSQDTAQVPNLANTTLAPYEQVMAKKIDDYFRQELIYKRNRRMGQRVLELLATHPDKSFFFAFGAGHFLGNQTVIDVVRAGGYSVVPLAAHHKIHRPRRKHQERPRASLVPRPTSLRDFTLTSNNLETKDEVFSHYLSTFVRSKVPVTEPESLAKPKPTWRPPVLLTTSRSVAGASVRSLGSQPNKGDIRNFNDLWVRLDSNGNALSRSSPLGADSRQPVKVWYEPAPKMASASSVMAPQGFTCAISALIAILRAKLS